MKPLPVLVRDDCSDEESQYSGSEPTGPPEIVLSEDGQILALPDSPLNIPITPLDIPVNWDDLRARWVNPESLASLDPFEDMTELDDNDQYIEYESPMTLEPLRLASAVRKCIWEPLETSDRTESGIRDISPLTATELNPAPRATTAVTRMKRHGRFVSLDEAELLMKTVQSEETRESFLFLLSPIDMT